jgi:hypothetical protein
MIETRIAHEAPGRTRAYSKVEVAIFVADVKGSQ